MDLSQSPQRMRWTFAWHDDKKEGIICAPTLLPGTILWLTFPDPGVGTSDTGLDIHNRLVEERPLIAEEKMLLQGWPCNETSPVSLADHRGILSKMAGNMFTSSVFLTVFASMFYIIPWVKASPSSWQPAEEEHDMLASMATFHMLTRGARH